ncbi:MAG: hypothetical protein V4584_11050 [Verrucomicrobiota bacterium]
MKSPRFPQPPRFTSIALASAFAATLGLASAKSGARDLDGDGIANRVDADVDGDGIFNGRDANVDGGVCRRGPLKGRYVGDHLPNGSPREKDIDGDGLKDGSDAELDIDGDGKKDDAKKEKDIDGDGKADDSDGERDIDGDEIENGLDDDCDGDGRARDRDQDDDGDGTGDAEDDDDDNDGTDDVTGEDDDDDEAGDDGVFHDETIISGGGTIITGGTVEDPLGPGRSGGTVTINGGLDLETSTGLVDSYGSVTIWSLGGGMDPAAAISWLLSFSGMERDISYIPDLWQVDGSEQPDSVSSMIESSERLNPAVVAAWLLLVSERERGTSPIPDLWRIEGTEETLDGRRGGRRLLEETDPAGE